MNSRAGFSFLLALVALLAAVPLGTTGITTAAGQCLDYSEYLHVVANIPVEAKHLDQAGDFVYLSSLQVIDVSVPGAPAVAGSFPGQDGDVRGITATATNLFVIYSAADGAGFNGLAIYDRSNPVAPTLLSTVVMPQFMTQLRVIGDRVYLRNDQGRLIIVDISDPSLPTPGASIGQGWLDSFDVNGNLLYAVDNIRNDVVVIDVTDPLSLQIDYRLNLPDVISIIFHRGYGYFLDVSQGTRILEFTAPDQYTIANDLPGLTRPLVIRGDMGYAYGTPLQIYELVTPASPVLLATVPFNVRSGLLDGTRALLGISNSFVEMDLTNTADLPGVAATVDLAANLTAMIPAGDHLIAMSQGGFETFDATDCTAPVFLAAVPWQAQVLGQALAGDYFYVLQAGPSFGRAVLKVFDVSDMSAPGEVASKNLNGILSGLTAVGDFLYTAEFGALIVINVVDPLDPFQFSRTDNLGFTPITAVSGSDMAVADGTLLRHFDVSSPDNPTPLTPLDTGVEGQQVLIADGVTYFAHRGGVKLYGVTTGGAMSMLADVTVPGIVDGIAAFAGTLYVEGSGIYMLDVTDPAAPFFVGNLGYVAERADHLTILGECVYFDQYVSRDRGRLNIFHRHCELTVPQDPTVTIDIKPGSKNNRVNCRPNRGIIRVAILTTPDFDALQVDHTTVRFGHGEAGEVHAERRGRGRSRHDRVLKRHEKDVDHDGDVDLVFHFSLQKAKISCGDTEAALTGKTYDGRTFTGSDAVRVRHRGGNHDGDDDKSGSHDADIVVSFKPTLGLFPNPFNPRTTIAFSLPATEHLRVEVYDLTGRRVAVVADEVFGAGAHQVIWSGTDDGGRPAASGVYFVRLAGQTVNLQRRAVLLK